MKTKIIETRSVIAVRDLAAAAKHYGEVLGFEVQDFAPGWLIFKLDGFLIQAGECPTEMAAGETGDHSYFAYVELDEIDAYFAQVSGNGAEIIKALTDETWGMREFAVRTVDGHRIMFGMAIQAG